MNRAVIISFLSTIFFILNRGRQLISSSDKLDIVSSRINILHNAHQRRVRSITECAVLCRYNGTCTLFEFNRITYSCKLSFNPPGQLIPTSGDYRLGIMPAAPTTTSTAIPPTTTTTAIAGYARVQEAGFAWEAFWWYYAVNPYPSAPDILQDAYGLCSPGAAYCFGRLPPFITENLSALLAIDGDGTKYMWTFDSTNQIANAAWNAFQNHQAVLKSSYDHWRPTAIAGPTFTGDQKCFKYGNLVSSYAQTTGICLADNVGECDTTLEMGTSFSSMPPGQGVDILYGAGCTEVSTSKSLTLYYRL